MGRPKIHEKRTTLNLTMEADVAELAKAAARSQGISTSQYVTKLLQRDMEKQRKKNIPS